MVARLKTRSRGESGRLTIGVHASLSAGNLRATLMDHRRTFPDVEIHLVDGSSDHLISDLANSAIDVAFVAENDSNGNDSRFRSGANGSSSLCRKIIRSAAVMLFTGMT